MLIFCSRQKTEFLRGLPCVPKEVRFTESTFPEGYGRRDLEVGDAAKTLYHEYLHHASSAGESFVPKDFRGEFARGSEGFFRQHAWIWGESARLHRDLAETIGATGVGLTSGVYAKMAEVYESSTFDEFVDYIKAQGMDLY